MKLSDNATVVFHGFLNLPNLEKLSVVEAINEYFDSNEKDRIRDEHEKSYVATERATPGFRCVCCER